MNRLGIHIVYSILILGILTQCDSIVSPSDQAESYSDRPTETTSPSNADQQPVETVLKWEQSKNIESYRIMISESDSFDSTVIDTTVSGASFTTPPMAPGATFKWKVYPNKGEESGPWS